MRKNGFALHSSIRSQLHVETEITFVDSGSTDRTVYIVQLVGIDKLVTIDEYTPGLSLNSASMRLAMSL